MDIHRDKKVLRKKQEGFESCEPGTSHRRDAETQRTEKANAPLLLLFRRSERKCADTGQTGNQPSLKS